ncbi:hypothetical protein GCM10023205_79220 [Yinghuangia aomiensis]|uniref:Serine phosphatase RsbU, regulator of sigma subunit n=1 Tax=Yinghuangia aomiensis TaxID=676205 RepID=A0ABP9IDV0_9ACTN
MNSPDAARARAGPAASGESGPPTAESTEAVVIDRAGRVLSATPDAAWLLGAFLDLFRRRGAPSSGTVVLHPPHGPCDYQYTLAPLASDTSAGSRLVLLRRSGEKGRDTARRREERLESVARNAAVGIAGTLDFREVAERLAHALVPDFADVATVEVPEAVLRTDDAPAEDLASRRLFRVAVATAAGGTPPGFLPAGAPMPPLPARPDVGPLRDGPVLVVADVDDFRRRLGLGEADSPAVIPVGAHALLSAPMLGGDRTLGVLTAWRTTDPDDFGDAEVELFVEIASRGALALDNARRYAREHRVAVALQRSLLPPRTTGADAAETAGTYVPAGGEAGVGGDWYDVLPLASLRTAFVIGDVVGHGLGSTVTMGRLRTAVQTMAEADPSPRELLTRLDDMVAARAIEGDGDRSDDHADADVAVSALCTTAMYAVFDPIRRTCAIASAGHPPPLVLRPGHAAEFAAVDPGPPMGIGGLPFEETEIAVPPGSILAFYTDGLVKQGGAAGIVAGMNALAGALDEHRELHIEAIGQAVLERLEPSKRDDAALLLVRTREVPQDHVAEWELPADPSVVAKAREMAGRRLAAWGLDELAFTTELGPVLGSDHGRVGRLRSQIMAPRRWSPAR